MLQRISRRHLLKLLALGAVSPNIDVERLLWVPKKTIFTFTSRQIAFYYGIPYHQYNASSGSWIGIPRTEAYPEIMNLIKVLEDDKKR